MKLMHCAFALCLFMLAIAFIGCGGGGSNAIEPAPTQHEHKLVFCENHPSKVCVVKNAETLVLACKVRVDVMVQHDNDAPVVEQMKDRRCLKYNESTQKWDVFTPGQWKSDGSPCFQIDDKSAEVWYAVDGYSQYQGEYSYLYKMFTVNRDGPPVESSAFQALAGGAKTSPPPPRR